MKRALQLFAIAGIFVVSNECAADETPFQVLLQIVRDVPIIQFEAVANKVVLTGFNVNRGNCKSAKLGRSYPLPLTFKFGDGVKFFTHTCKVKEVVLMISQGTFAYSFR